MFEAPAIIGTCINCIAPGSLSATLAFVLIGAGVVLTAERRKLALLWQIVRFGELIRIPESIFQ
jgi:hypothetical protein